MDPETSDAPERWIGALQTVPDIAQLLGVYLGQTTGYELMLGKFFGYLAGVHSQDVVKAVFGRIINISTKLEILDALAELPENQRWHPKVGELLRTARAINGRRNEYVHGTYRVSPSSKVVELLTWITSESRKSKRYEVTEEMIRADIHCIACFLGDSMSLFHPELELPPSNIPDA